MKNSTIILGAMALAFTGSSIYLGGQLSDAHGELDQAGQARIADEARIRQLEAEVRSLQGASRRVASVPPAPSGPPPSLLNERKPEGPPPPGSDAPRPPPGDRPNLNDTPAAQSNRRQNQEVRLRRMYAGMSEELGLDANQADKLFNLLADSRVTTFDDMRAYDGDPVGRQAIQDAARAQRDAEINALLGPDKAAEFHTFEKSIPARMQVNRIGENLAASNLPLSAEQRSSMVAAVFAEQQARPQPERVPNPTPEYEARFLDWQAQYSRRVQALVEPLLTAEQVTQYRQAVEVQNSRRAEQRARVERRRNPGDGRQ